MYVCLCISPPPCHQHHHIELLTARVNKLSVAELGVHLLFFTKPRFLLYLLCLPISLSHTHIRAKTMHQNRQIKGNTVQHVPPSQKKKRTEISNFICYFMCIFYNKPFHQYTPFTCLSWKNTVLHSDISDSMLFLLDEFRNNGRIIRYEFCVQIFYSKRQGK